MIIGPLWAMLSAIYTTMTSLVTNEGCLMSFQANCAGQLAVVCEVVGVLIHAFRCDMPFYVPYYD
eukprot:scaffold58997_cov33-Prasinocladus_malaysianus.AAC.1